MPDQPISNRRPAPTPRRSAAASDVRYAELHAKTNFSFLEGASHPDELIAAAAELGLAAIAVTDRNSLAGMARAHAAAKALEQKLLVGAEITPTDAPSALLWASDRAAYGRLSRLITTGRRRAPKGQFAARFADVAEHASGLLAGVLIAHPNPDDAAQRAELARYRDAFGDRCYLLAELSLGPNDASRLDRFVTLARRARLPLAAAGDVHYHRRSRLALQDTLTAIRLGTTIDAAGDALFPNAERCLKSPAQMSERFACAPEAIARTMEIAARVHFSLDELRYEYPEELAPPGQSTADYLAQLTWAGAARRYPTGVPDKVRSLIDYELALIIELKFEAYFLTVYDLVRFARSREILCQGRGSAANSAVCYCLGVTSVDPGRSDVLFERFISRERNEAPDIDVDFEHERREEVLQYVYEKYGRERAGMTAEVISYRPRSAVRDVGKALGLSLDRVDAIAKGLERENRGDLAQRMADAGLDVESPLGRRLAELVSELLGFPRHLGQHVGGMVITRGPLSELVPIENAAMDGRTVIEWDKNDLDELGILKVDCLSLGMLTAIRKCFDLIEPQAGRLFTLATIPAEDPAVYDMICLADTMGVFQIESRAQMSMLPRLKPREFYDLVIEVAIVRPGPIQGNMVHPYLRRRAGEEPVAFPNEAIRAVLSKTLGVPLFQEQAMRLAVVAAGFTPGEADGLRRAMGAWRKTGVIEKFRQRLIDGMTQRGLSAEFAENVFRQIRGFGEYGFPESHAASFALLVYVSAWLKHYYPAAFAAALINSQPMGFYAPAQLVRNAREHGVEVRPIDVNHSRWDCTLEPTAATNGASSDASGPALRLGLRMVSGLAEEHALAIEAARQAKPFTTIDDVARRARLSQALLARLARAAAFDSLGLDRRQALWQSLGKERSTQLVESQPLFQSLEADDDALVALPLVSDEQEVLADYATVGLSLRDHPLAFHRGELATLDVTPSDELARLTNGRLLRVAGIVLVRQRPSTARGITFVTLEDEFGTVNLIVHREIWRRYFRAARTATALLAVGRLQRQGIVIHVLVSELYDLSQQLSGLRSQSRDFH
jgi:error-prone DNA polymerase